MRSRIGKKGTVLLAVVFLTATAVAGGALAAVAARDTAAATATTRINATETNYAIALSKSSGIPVGYVTFVVHNSATTAHRFGVKGKNFTTKSILTLIQPGQTKTLKVQFLHKGTYTVFCKLHLTSGMKSTLTVGPTTGTTTHATTSTSTSTKTYTYTNMQNP